MEIKRKSKYNNIPMGIAIGLLIPIVFFLIYYLIQGVPQEKSLGEFIYSYYFRSVLPNILSLCAIPNLLAFWLFLQKKYYRTTRGIIIALFMLLVYVAIDKLLTI